MKYILLPIILFLFNITGAQTLKLIVSGSSNEKAFIYSIQGETTALVDSLERSGGDEFIYKFDRHKYHAGFYRIDIGLNKWVDFIYDGENIEIKTDANNILDSLNIIRSESNRQYYSFIRLNKKFKEKTELLHLILQRYPKGDSYYRQTKDELKDIQNEYLNFINNISQKDSGSFIAKYIMSFQLPVIDPNFSAAQQLAFLKEHSLDNVDFKDGELINSNLFTAKTIEYLTYYRDPQLPRDLLEKEYIPAIDTILNKAKVNYRVYKQIVEYLIDGFKKFGFDRDLNYVIENYVIKDDLCLDDHTEKSIQLMLEQDRILHSNASAPDIVMKDTSGNQVDLKKIKADKILILFYVSWCPHCQAIIPKLAEYLNQHKQIKLKVLAISLDTNKIDWLNFIKNNNLHWINLSDLKGWNDKAATDYFVYATPTMFLLDKNKKIIGKPLTIDDLKNLL